MYTVPSDFLPSMSISVLPHMSIDKQTASNGVTIKNITLRRQKKWCRIAENSIKFAARPTKIHTRYPGDWKAVTAGWHHGQTRHRLVHLSVSWWRLRGWTRRRPPIPRRRERRRSNSPLPPSRRRRRSYCWLRRRTVPNQRGRTTWWWCVC